MCYKQFFYLIEMKLKQIERVKKISKADFISQYVKNQIPVVVEELTEDWPAYHKWKLSYINEIAGNIIVPLYDDRPVNHEEGFNEAHTTMKMSDYIHLLESKPTNYRIFLYNLMKEVPLLKEDFLWPDIGLNLVKQMPMLFFGGETLHNFSLALTIGILFGIYSSVLVACPVAMWLGVSQRNLSQDQPKENQSQEINP